MQRLLSSSPRVAPAVDRDSPLHDYQQAKTYFDRGDFTTAKRLYSRSLDKFPSILSQDNRLLRGTLYYCLGSTCKRLGEWHEAARAYMHCYQIRNALKGFDDAATKKARQSALKMMEEMMRLEHPQAATVVAPAHGDSDTGTAHPDGGVSEHK